MPPDGPARIMAGVAVVVVAYGALFGGAELLRRWGIPGEQTRSTVHVGAGILALGLPYLFGSPWPVLAMAIAFAGAMIVSERVGLLGSIHDIPRRTVGAAMFPIGIAAAYALTGGQVPGYPIAVLALALGDPAAAMTGRRFARRSATIWGTPRSIEGSAVACLVAAAVTVVVLVVAGGVDQPPLLSTSLVVGLSVALAEATSPRGLDNVAIPVVAAIVLEVADGPWLVTAVLGALAVSTIVGLAWDRPDRPVMIGPTGRNGPTP